MLLGEFVSFLSFFFQLIKIINNNSKKKIHKIKADDGFGTVCKVDAGYYSQGFCFIFLFQNHSNLSLTFLSK